MTFDIVCELELRTGMKLKPEPESVIINLFLTISDLQLLHDGMVAGEKKSQVIAIKAQNNITSADAVHRSYSNSLTIEPCGKIMWGNQAEATINVEKITVPVRKKIHGCTDIFLLMLSLRSNLVEKSFWSH